MAQKKKASPKKSSSNVTRIKATDTTPSKATEASTKSVAKKTAAPTEQTVKKTRKRSAKGAARPFVAIKNYFAGAWYELKQVRWPTRRATWSLTFAVLVYSAFFVLLVILLDVLFKYVFDLILGK